jgi:hypothetical protein
MGDRCYWKATAHPDDAAKLAELLGVGPELESEPPWELADNEANYGHYDAMEQAAEDHGLRFYGWHSEGGEYTAIEFCAGGGDFYYIEANVHGPVVRVNEDGIPGEHDLELARDYSAAYKRIKAEIHEAIATQEKPAA